MNELFEEYGLFCISVIGGTLGLQILANEIFISGNSFSVLISNILEGLM